MIINRFCRLEHNVVAHPGYAEDTVGRDFLMNRFRIRVLDSLRQESQTVIPRALLPKFKE
jgi:hypothetical protein